MKAREAVLAEGFRQMATSARQKPPTPQRQTKARANDSYSASHPTCNQRIKRDYMAYELWAMWLLLDCPHHA